MKVLPVSIQEFNALLLDADPKKKVYSHNKVRTSLRDRTLDSMFPVTNQSQQPEVSSSTSEITPLNTLSKQRDVIESTCYLTSVKNLRQQVAKGKHRRECPTSFVKDS
jgi:DNA mismatch repair protein MLH1